MIGVDQVQHESANNLGDRSINKLAYKDDATSSSLSTEEEHVQIPCNDIEDEDNTQVDIDDSTQKAKHCKISIKNKRSHQHRQHLPLYISSLCAITALTLSIITHKSTSFVTLTEPLNAGPFFKSINEIGLNYWKLCSIKQDGLDFILDEKKIMQSSRNDDEVLESSSSDTIKEGPRGPYIETNQDDDLSNKVQIMQDGSGQRLELPPSISFIRTAHDIVRNITSTVQTTYHDSNPSQEQRDWYSEPNHDDILVSGDYPYHDDDYLYESSTISNEEIYWNCHILYFTSKSNRLDTMWNIARMFEMLGILFGFSATLLLGLLIIRRSGFSIIGQGKDGRSCYRLTSIRSDRRRTSSASEQHHYQQTNPTKSNDLLQLDTNTSGYRPISILFLLSYLLQSLTLLFLDSNICREQVCALSTGAHMLLLSCVLWIVCGLLMLFMMKRVMKNERRVRRLKRRMLLQSSSGTRDESSTMEEDVKCLIPNSSTSTEEEV